MKNLREILELHGKYIRGDVGGVRADLREADLSVADLREADLSVADLRGADLREADLSVADLRGADLREADLRVADLRGADLTNTISDFTIFKSISGLKYPIVIKDSLIKVGCQEHLIDKWLRFNTADINDMDSENALVFYPLLVNILLHHFPEYNK